MRHRVTLTNPDGTVIYRGPESLPFLQRRCTCGWTGARRDSHPPMSIEDAIESIGPRTR